MSHRRKTITLHFTGDKANKTLTIKNLSLVKITDMNQPLLSKSFYNFNPEEAWLVQSYLSSLNLLGTNFAFLNHASLV